MHRRPVGLAGLKSASDTSASLRATGAQLDAAQMAEVRGRRRRCFLSGAMPRVLGGGLHTLLCARHRGHQPVPLGRV